jgi:hypothetical protein
MQATTARLFPFRHLCASLCSPSWDFHWILIAFYYSNDKPNPMLFRATFLALFFQTFGLFAAQLDLAVVEFPEPKTVEQLAAALPKCQLSDLTNSDRTVTKNPDLESGYVLFSQSFPASPEVQSTTRMKSSRVEVSSRLQNGMLQVQITLSEGNDSGLHLFTKRVYQGQAPFKPGSPQVISLRQFTAKSKIFSKNHSDFKETTSSIAILAQLK